MSLTEELREQTTRFVDAHYPGRGGVSKLSRELAPLTGQKPRVVAQMFRYYLGQGKGQNPDRFWLYYVKDLQHPARDWALACLAIYDGQGEGLPE
jgi:hypothetical protein